MYTKYTDTQYTEQSWIQYIEFNSSFKVTGVIEAAKLAQEGKTDDLPFATGSLTVRRLWINQEAADNWKTYLTQLATDYGVTITQITIGDL
jgi:hypothetical protein